MSQIHTPGPIRVGKPALSNCAYTLYSGPEIEGGGSYCAHIPGHPTLTVEADARLLAAAYNAFDSAAAKLGVNAVELAERMSTCGIADLSERLRDILRRFRSCIAQGNGEIGDDRQAIAKAEAALAKVKGCEV